MSGVCLSVMVVCDGSVRLVLSHCVMGVEWRCVWVCGLVALSSPSSSSSFSFLLLVFGVVRAQPCEHARYPRTPLCSLFLLFALSFLFLSSAPRLSSVCLEWRWVCGHHVSECSVGMTATGSLSLSPSFFW